MDARVPKHLTLAGCLALFLACSVILAQSGIRTAQAQPTAKIITVWKVGDPYKGEMPGVAVPPGLESSAEELGYVLKAQSFPAQGFASVFFRAYEQHQAPDILVFNNIGILQGGSTPMGTLTGIATDPEIHSALVNVTGSLKALQQRAWQYLIRGSPNYEAARALAMRPPECRANSEAPEPPAELREVSEKAAKAYLEFDPSLEAFEDPDRLHTEISEPKERHLQTVKWCQSWATDHLAFIRAIASYTSPAAIGWIDVLMVLRKQGSQWRLLVGSTDSVSTDSFVADVPRLVSLVTNTRSGGNIPEPPSLVSPPDGESPITAPGARFGDFSWHTSPSPGEVAEIVEFAYNGDARLVAIIFSGAAPATEHCSAGLLWNTESEWKWRVWSITDAGDLSFSKARSFPH